MAMAVIFTGTAMFITISDSASAGGTEMPEYAKKLFDTSYVHTIDISMSENDRENMLENAIDEEYKSCDVTIDGTKIKNVAIRPKGNTSLTNVQSLDSDRYSFKIDFDKYNDGGNYLGLDKLCLNNIIQDNTYMKDYFSYRMISEAGGEAPLCSYIYVIVNGREHGLYLAVEGIEKAFARRNYGSDYGEIYKPESMSMGKDKDKMPSPPEGFDKMRENGNQNPDNVKNESGNSETRVNKDDFKKNENQQSGSMGNKDNPPGSGYESGTRHGMQRGENKGGGPGMKNSAVSLMYTDDDIDSYSDIFDYSVFDADKSDKKRLIKSIKQLNEGKKLWEVVDTDEVLRYFVGHNFTVNFDSYTGSMMHNYYLHEKDGKMSTIAWDYNLAFGGFANGGPGGAPGGKNGGQNPDSAKDKPAGFDVKDGNKEQGFENKEETSSTEMVNYPIDTPVSGTTLEDRPMIGKLLEQDEYMDLYHRYMDEFISEYMESGKFESEYNMIFNMIYKYVAKDPTKFCTLEEFVKGAETLKEFCLLRTESVRGQLDGTIPSTTDGQSADSSSLTDASNISISDMGSMNFGKGKNRGEGFGDNPPNGENDMPKTPDNINAPPMMDNRKNTADVKSIVTLLIWCFVIMAATFGVKLYKRK